MSELFLGKNFTLHRHAMVTATNDETQRLAKAGARAGAVVWAAQQVTTANNNGEESWIGASPDNLFASLLLRPPSAAPLQGGDLASVAALSVAQSLQDMLETHDATDRCDPPVPGQATCEHTRHILINGAKVAGIFVSSSPGNVGSCWFIIGIAINLAKAPPEGKAGATCLKAQGVHMSPFQALKQIFPALWTCYHHHWFGGLESKAATE